jgi:hypothetical protein
MTWFVTWKHMLSAPGEERGWPWPLVRLHIPEIVAAVNTATPGSYVEVDIPLRARTPFTRFS